MRWWRASARTPLLEELLMAAQSEQDAIKKVPKHVSPKDCFVWFMNNKVGFAPCPGTGCAHWIAHEKGWNNGREGSNGCHKKFLIRVKDIVGKSGSEVDPQNVKVGNVWVNDGASHCGIVCKVTPAKAGAKDPNPTIEIEHCSSGQGKVAKNDWAKFFKAGGTFYRG
jgi:hypothetical protein